jgi:hypothetical protein
VDRLCGGIDPVSLALQNALGFEAERHIVRDVPPRKQRRVLEHHDAGGKRPCDRLAVFAQRAGSGRIKSRDQPQQSRFAASGGTQQGNEFARLEAEAYVFQHGENRAVDVEGMAHAFDIQRGADHSRRRRFGPRERYHLTTPFCQTSSRSRIRNNRVIAPEHNSDITISAAYMLE